MDWPRANNNLYLTDTTREFRKVCQLIGSRKGNNYKKIEFPLIGEKKYISIKLDL
jgi:hypothetical protein